jgi:hypothetical protein
VARRHFTNDEWRFLESRLGEMLVIMGKADPAEYPIQAKVRELAILCQNRGKTDYALIFMTTLAALDRGDPKQLMDVMAAMMDMIPETPDPRRY